MSSLLLPDVTTQAAVPRVDLLPEGLDDARNFRRLQGGLGLALVCVVGLLAAAHSIGAGHVSAAEDALGVEQTRTAQLRTEAARYADVPVVEAQVAAAESAQRAVTAYDVSWFSLLNSIAAGTPANTTINSLTLTLDAAATAPGGAGAVAATDPLGVQGVGSLNLLGSTVSQDKVASMLEGLAGVPGLAHPLVSTSTYTADTGVVAYTTSATITHDALLNQQ